MDPEELEPWGTTQLCRAAYLETHIPVGLELPKLVWLIV
jgi:hypothetical protein